jgi:ABC-type molybdate transport system substrate-binding protein
MKKTLPSAVLLVSALSAGIACAQPAGENVKIYAAAVVKTPLTALAAEYEQATGNVVTVVFDTAGATEQRFRADPQATLKKVEKLKIKGDMGAAMKLQKLF